MIAMNYIKHPEALRFQCEMFSNGYHNSPRIMRLMQCIFDQRPDVPQWFKDMRAKAKALVQAWKKKQDVLAFGNQLVKKPHKNPAMKIQYEGPNGETWTGRGLMPRWLRSRIEHLGEEANKWRFH